MYAKMFVVRLAECGEVMHIFHEAANYAPPALAQGHNSQQNTADDNAEIKIPNNPNGGQILFSHPPFLFAINFFFFPKLLI